MKKIIFILTCLSTLGGHLVAQNPKWFKKAAKAQISIVTMNEKGDMLQSGSGFFIDKNGTALADYQLFKQASKAKVVSGEGKEYEVEAIVGVSSLYDLVKFRVKTDKDTPALTISDRMGVKHEHVYVLPYPTKENKMCVNDTLHDIQKFNEKYGYYTLGRPLDEKYLNSPVMDEEGEVLGMIQRKANASATTSYAVSVAYGNTLCTNGMSSADNDLNAIHIRKALPADEADIRTFLFMTASRSDSTTYNQYLNDYAEQFPKSSEPYTQRADFYMAHGNYAAAEEDMNAAMDVAEKKDEVYYAFTRRRSLQAKSSPPLYTSGRQYALCTQRLRKGLRKILVLDGNQHAFGQPVPLRRPMQTDGRSRYATDTGIARQCRGMFQQTLFKRCCTGIVGALQHFARLGPLPGCYFGSK